MFLICQPQPKPQFMVLSSPPKGVNKKRLHHQCVVDMILINKILDKLGKGQSKSLICHNVVGALICCLLGGYLLYLLELK